MQLESFDEQSNLKSAGTMSVEIPLKILADSRALSVDPEGWARLAVYNGGEEKARYVLAFCAQDLGAATGSQAMLSMESPAYVFARIPLGEVDVGEPGGALCLSGGEDGCAGGANNRLAPARNGSRPRLPLAALSSVLSPWRISRP